MDNLIQIAHNVRVGKNCLIAGGVAIAGSTIIGDWVTIAGQVGIINHLNIGDKIELIPSDISSIMNQFNFLSVVKTDKLISTYEITARGAYK